MQLCVALAAACCQLAGAQGSLGTKWAVLVTGSHTYDNYRHHADVAHGYQRLVAGGVPPSQIISLQYNDVPTDPENPYNNTLFNKASGKLQGDNVNKGFVRSFTGSSVTRSTFLSVLSCNFTQAGTPCLRSTAADTVFIYWAGHGGTGILLFPDMSSSSALYADELVGALTQLKAQKKFKKMVVYVEACESGSMFATLPSTLNIYAVTAASATQDSYPIYCCVYNRPPSCTVAGQDIGSCLGDMFSVGWLTNADRGGATLEQNYRYAKAHTAEKFGNPGSTVKQFGDTSFTSDPLSDFVGAVSTDKSTATATAANTSAMPPDVRGGAGVPRARADPRADHKRVLAQIAAAIPGFGAWPLAGSPRAPTSAAGFGCYRRANDLVETACRQRLATPHGTAPPSSPLQGLFWLTLRCCEAGLEEQLSTAVGAVCPQA